MGGRGGRHGNRAAPKNLNGAKTRSYTLAELQGKKERSIEAHNSFPEGSRTESPAKKHMSQQASASLLRQLNPNEQNGELAENTLTAPAFSQSSPPGHISKIPRLSQNKEGNGGVASGPRNVGVREGVLTQNRTTSPDRDEMNLDDTPPRDPPPGNEVNGNAENLLRQVLDRLNSVEGKLEKLDAVESQLTKLDSIESKTVSIGTEIQNVKKSVESLYEEVDKVKSKAQSNEEKLRKELAAVKSQMREREAKFTALAGEIEEKVTKETQFHFNAFTKKIEHAFIKEQSVSRRNNLIFSGVRKNMRKSEKEFI